MVFLGGFYEDLSVIMKGWSVNLVEFDYLVN